MLTGIEVRHDTSAAKAAIAFAIFALIGLGGCRADPGAGDSIDDLPLIGLVEEQRIGSVDDPDTGFSSIAAVDVDRDGNVYVLDRLSHDIRVYDPTGTLLRRIGRRGGGPGEFENLPRFGVKGDTIWTYDFPPGRITLFNRRGDVLSTGRTPGHPVPVRTGTGFLTPSAMKPDGSLVSWFTRIAYGRDTDPAPVTGGPVIPRVVFNTSGEVVDTLGFLPAAPPRMVPPANHQGGRWERITVGGQAYTVPDPPPDLPIWVALDDGHAVVDVPYATSPENGAFTVTRLGSNGDTVFHRVLRYRPQRYSERELMAAAAQQPLAFIINGVRQERTLDQAVVNAIRARMSFPEYMLPINAAWAAQDGSLWLQLRTDRDASPRWAILDAEGRLTGAIELPRGALPLWVNGDVILAAVPDELDVPWLVKYRRGAIRHPT